MVCETHPLVRQAMAVRWLPDIGSFIPLALIVEGYQPMELRQVRYFVAVAETLNFRKASDQLHVSQPSLSVQIKQLEDELGVSLFRRSKRQVEITRAGEVFLSAAREILLRLQQASAAALHAES